MPQTINPDALSYWQDLLTSPSPYVQQNARSMLTQSGYDATGKPITPGTNNVPTTTGATPTAYRPDTGGVPQVPNLGAVQRDALAANASALPSIESLGESLNASNQKSLLDQYRTALPGYDNLTAASSGNIQNLLHGEIPQDVQNRIINTAAERGIATGLYDSPNSDASLLQALGLTSLGLEKQGESELTAAIGRTPTVSPVDLTRMFVDPTQAYDAQLLANIYASAPQPGAAKDSLLNTLGAGYNAGRSNVPGTRGTGNAGASSVSPSAAFRGGTGGVSNPVSPLGQTDAETQWFFDPKSGMYVNTVTGQFADSPSSQPYGDFNYANWQQGWHWDEDMKQFYNPNTGEYSDNPAAGYSQGYDEDYYAPSFTEEGGGE